jgi:hypothetical protein
MSDTSGIDLFATDSADRVREHTPEGLQADLDGALVDRVRQLAEEAARSPEDAHRILSRRIEELEQESDIERVLAANAATLAFTGTALGVLHHRRWLALPAVVTGFLLQHAIQGWCPPVPLFRRLGIRTSREISAERYALKALRGDFSPVESHRDPAERARSALRAVAG